METCTICGKGQAKFGSLCPKCYECDEGQKLGPTWVCIDNKTSFRAGLRKAAEICLRVPMERAKGQRYMRDKCAEDIYNFLASKKYYHNR